MSLTLRGNLNITAAGWSAMLKLVCDYSSINGILQSNHTLHNLGVQILAHDRESVNLALGTDNANLLRTALEVNRSSNKTVVARCKLIWSHVGGNVNIGGAEIESLAMPEIIAWFSDDAKNMNPGAELVQYYDPPLQKGRIDAIRLSAIYSIVRTRPDFFLSTDQVTRTCKWTGNIELLYRLMFVVLIYCTVHVVRRCNAALIALLVASIVLLPNTKTTTNN